MKNNIKSRIFKYAHKLKKAKNISLSEALKLAWRRGKFQIVIEYYGIPKKTDNPKNVLKRYIDEIYYNYGGDYKFISDMVTSLFYFNTGDGYVLYGNAYEYAKMSHRELNSIIGDKASM